MDITRKHDSIEHYFTIVLIDELIHANMPSARGAFLKKLNQGSLSGNQLQMVSVTESAAFPIDPFRTLLCAGTKPN